MDEETCYFLNSCKKSMNKSAYNSESSGKLVLESLVLLSCSVRILLLPALQELDLVYLFHISPKLRQIDISSTSEVGGYVSFLLPVLLLLSVFLPDQRLL